MLRTSIFSMAFVALLSFILPNTIDTCSINGKITDKSNSSAIQFANVSLFKDSNILASVSSDANGEYCFTGISAGTYSIQISSPGYDKLILNNLEYDGKTILSKNIQLQALQNQSDSVSVTITEEMEMNNVDLLAPITISQNTSSKNYNMRGARYKKCEAYSSGYNYPSPAKEAFNTEEYDKINDNEFKEAKKNALSTFSIDVDKASYSNVRRFITEGSLPPADAVRIEEMMNYFNYNYPQPEGDQPFSITTEFTDCPWNKSHKLIHIGLQGKEVKTDNIPKNNLVFLLDVSGSMEDPNKLPLLKSGLTLLINQLRPQDKVAIVVYAGAAGIVLPSTDGSHKDRILDALEKLQAGGSTAGGEGIQLAYKVAKENFMKDGNNRVILATDGDFNVGVSSDGELVRMIEQKREQGVFLTVLGFGSGNYKDSKMEQLADKGNGNYAYIDNILEAKKVLVKEMGGTLLTIAKDVKIQVEFNPAQVKAYRLVGYENRVLANEDFNDDKKDAGELGSGHTVTAMYEIIPAGSTEEVASIDPLKYQPTSPTQAPSSFGNEIMTIKYRYKAPKENTSKLISQIVTDKKTPFSLASENCRFSSSVVEFGMLLRDSKFKGDANFKDVLTMARSSKGRDMEGYRAEFIRLVEMAELLKK